MSATNRFKSVVLLSLLLILIAGFLSLLLFVFPSGGEQPREEPVTDEPREDDPGEGEPREDDPRRDDPRREEPPSLDDLREEELTDRPGDEQPGVEIFPAPDGFIYLVVDDAGHDLADVAPYLALPFPVTIAILPDQKASAATARAVLEAGKESILHLPMEPSGDANPGAGAILTSHTDEEILATVERHLSSFPEVIGVNNHMGSKATTDPRVMALVMAEVAERRLFFLDSRTSADSVAAGIARALGVPFAERTVFLDNERSDEAVAAQLAEAARLASEQGYAVAIGHVTDPVVARVVAAKELELRRRGIAFAPLSGLF
ncbi:MAG: divergent polysaccharide deacetylase family protein [Spirochaetaceae bacterium]